MTPLAITARGKADLHAMKDRAEARHVVDVFIERRMRDPESGEDMRRVPAGSIIELYG